MGQAAPFVLLDDARAEGAADALLYEAPGEIFAAYRPGEVEDALARASAAQAEGRGVLAGYIAYEAGLALEPKLEGLAEARSGAAGPLVWLGLFDAPVRMAADSKPAESELPASVRSTRSSLPGDTKPPSPRCAKRSMRATFIRRTSPIRSPVPIAAIRSRSTGSCARRRRPVMAGCCSTDRIGC